MDMPQRECTVPSGKFLSSFPQGDHSNSEEFASWGIEFLLNGGYS